VTESPNVRDDGCALVVLASAANFIGGHASTPASTV
jgi:hypothetical protein